MGGESPDVEAAASEARSIFSRLAAPAFLRRLDEAVGLPNRQPGRDACCMYARRK